ncbi:MAG: ABC-F family ATP-binding cassette domain-containing protein [Lachnospiraceae bacterium]|nr:ABC-F family ATP-binding cassette domain-containing protein [Lachnospiraceae bacterium]
MLQVKNLNLYHKKDLHPLVEELSFVLNDGDKAAVIGEEGNGKSTLLKLLYDGSLVEDYAEYSGEILKGRAVCGYLAQELPPEDRKRTVCEYLSEEPAFWDTPYAELVTWAGQLGIPEDLLYGDTRMGLLSGGEKVKIQLIRILSKRPDVLLLDEPSNDIDIATLEWLEKFIREYPFGVLYISHDETLLENTANMILHMEQLRTKTRSRCTVARSGYRDYVDKRLEGMERQERLATEEQAAYTKQMERFRRIHDKVERDQNNISRQNPAGARLLKKKMHAVKSMERRFEKQAEDMTKMPESEEAIFFRFAPGEGIPAGKWVADICLPGLYVKEEEGADRTAGESGSGADSGHTQGTRCLAEEIRLQVKGPEKICIIGKNGAGKTTLLRNLAEDLLKRKDLRTAYMPQNYEELLPMDKNPVEFLLQYLKEEGTKEQTTRIRTYLGSMKYTAGEMDHAIRDLSGGQKAKLLLLGMSMDHRNVLVLDEPTRNFSPLSGPVIRRLLSDFPGAIISVSHDRKYIREVCDTVYELDVRGLHRR